MDVLLAVGNSIYIVCKCMDAERWRLGTLHIHFIPGHYFISAGGQYNFMIILNVLADDKPLGCCILRYDIEANSDDMNHETEEYV